ncbi:MAG: hypothetical protein H0T69_11700 [Thermoleophilaceae bacterium]|nr:hypothetical protein [Thermoleophilaceae bacterium]
METMVARQGHQDDDPPSTGRAQHKRKQLRAEKRIAELEGELETERELRRDFELALELLQQQQPQDVGKMAGADEAGRPVEPDGAFAPGRAEVSAEDLPGQKPSQGTPKPAPTEPREERPEPPREPPDRPLEVSPDVWGVPLEAFPEEGSEGEPRGVGNSPGRGERTGPRSLLRRRERRSGR